MVSYLEKDPGWNNSSRRDPRTSIKLFGLHLSNNNSRDTCFITSNSTSSSAPTTSISRAAVLRVVVERHTVYTM